MCAQCKHNSGMYILVALAAIALAFAGSAIYVAQQGTIGLLQSRSYVNQVPVKVMLTGHGEGYSFTYPSSYIVEPAGKNFPALTVKEGMVGKLEIFKMKDFGDRPWGFEPSEEDEKLSSAEKQMYYDNYVPREQLTVGPKGNEYDVWLYYNANDAVTKQELHNIVKSITL